MWIVDNLRLSTRGGMQTCFTYIGPNGVKDRHCIASRVVDDEQSRTGVKTVFLVMLGKQLKALVAGDW